MAGYLGAIPVPQATQHRESFTATSGQTTFNTAGYTVGFLDVYLNGSHLSPADFTATNGSDVVLASGASTGDVCDIISYTAFEIADQTFTGTTTLTGNLLLGDNDKAIFGAGSDLQIYHDGSHSYISDQGTGNLRILADNLYINNAANNQNYISGISGAQVRLYYNGDIKLQTTSTGIDVTGAITADGLTVDGAVVFNEASADVDFRVESNGNANMLFVDGGNNRVGIGTSSPNAPLDIGTTAPEIRLTDATDNSYTRLRYDGASFFIEVDDDNSVAGSNFRIQVDGSEAMRIDSSGNLLVGTTSTTVASQTGTTQGVRIAGAQNIQVASTGVSAYFNKLDTDGDIVEFRKSGSEVGSIGTKARTSAGRIFVGNSNTRLLFDNGVDAIIPANNDGNDRDNAIDLGASGARWDDIYATNGTIQTSDRNEKQDIASLTSAEMLVAKRISALFKTFRWKDKVAAKGDNARTHTGIIAQDVQAAFTAESLDAGDYSLFISSTWWEHDVEVPAVEAVAEVTEDVVIAAVEEELDEEGNVSVEAQEERTEQRLITEAVEAVDAYTRTDTYDTEDEAPEGATSKTRMGIRYPELLSFVAAYNEQRFASIETRLTALEG